MANFKAEDETIVQEFNPSVTGAKLEVSESELPFVLTVVDENNNSVEYSVEMGEGGPVLRPNNPPH